MKTFDDVNGEIVGGDYRLYTIVSPNGKAQCKFWAEDDDIAMVRYREWMDNVKRECRNAVIVAMIYGEGDFELREQYLY